MAQNKVIPDKCKGCNHFMKRIGECSFSHHGVTYLEECLCHDCLVKPVCEIVCDPLRKQVNDVEFELRELARELNIQIKRV
jgi:hypothetical protein